MRTRKFITAAALAVLGLCGVRSAWADPLTTLFNTGVATNNPSTGVAVTMIPDNSADTHYNIIAATAPDVPGSPIVTLSNQYPISTGAWTPNKANAKWISPHGDESVGHNEPIGPYIYRTSFDLTGFIPNTASITGLVYEDNDLTNIKINTTSLGTSFVNGVLISTPFSINTGFIPGINTIDFYINNTSSKTGNASGLLVQMSGTATLAPVIENPVDPVGPGPVVPEPASIGLLSIAGFGLLMRRPAR